MIMLLIIISSTIDAPVILKHIHAPKCVSMYIPYYTMSQLCMHYAYFIVYNNKAP